MFAARAHLTHSRKLSEFEPTPPACMGLEMTASSRALFDLFADRNRFLSHAPMPFYASNPCPHSQPLLCNRLGHWTG